MSEHIGRVLGDRYRLVAPVGSGASALVFVADDVTLKRQVAVKLLHEGLAGDQRFLERFRAEAQTTASLNHQHLVAVHDWGFDEAPYLVTEYLAGGSLQAMIDAGTRITPSQALLVGLEATRALEHAHRRGLIHRDIKPSNLLFDEEGRLRVADFGLARALAEASVTEPTGSVLGSARYASPEQARGQQVDAKADVYSLALTLIEAMTGTIPFAADTMVGTLMARVDKPITVTDEVGPLATALVAAGQIDPADRPDAAGFAALLMEAAETLPRPAPLPLAGARSSATSMDPSPTDMGSPADAAGNAADAAGNAADAAGNAADAAAAEGPVTSGEVAPADGADDDDAEVWEDDLLPRRPLVFDPVDPTLPDTPLPDPAPPETSLPSVPLPDTTRGMPVAAAAAASGAIVAGVSADADAEVPTIQEATAIPRTPIADVGADEAATAGLSMDADETTVLPVVEDVPPVPLSRRQARKASRLDRQSVAPEFAPDETAITPVVPARAAVAAAPADRDEKSSPLWILAGFLLVAAMGVGVWFLWQNTEEPEVAVPNVVGQDFDDLGAMVGANGWEVVQLEGRKDQTVVGEIISQVPAEGTILPEGGELRVTVSIGNEMVSLPLQIEGLSVADTQLRLDAAGLVIGDQFQEPSETVPSGNVIRFAEAAFELPRGEAVNIVLSQGPVPRLVPDGLVGTQLADAEETLRALRLEPVAQAEYSYEIPENEVMQISPVPGTEVAVGTQIGLLVSRGPEPIEVPDLVGLELGDALDALDAARLCAGRIDGRTDATAEVLLSEPQAGEIITDPDDCVRIVTSEVDEEDVANPDEDA